MKQYFYQNHESGITVKALPISKKDGYEEKGYAFGVAVCGDMDSFDPDLGLGIVDNRCVVQPYSVIYGKITEQTFQAITQVIEDNILRTDQWKHGVPRIDK